MVTFVRLPGVKAVSGKARSTIYKDISLGLWPRPVKLGPRMVAWPRHEIDAVNAARVAGKSDAEIKDLVQRLEASRLEGRV